MLWNIWCELKRMWPLLALILVGFGLHNLDGEQLALVVSVQAVILLILVISHFTRKALFPYFKMETVYRQAVAERNLAAAVLFASMMLFIIALFVISVIVFRPASASGAEIPPQARPLLPLLSQAIDRHWTDAPLREAAAGQVEQESRWKVKAELKTYREYGFGLGQITKTARFDNFQAAQRLFPGWKWEDRFNPSYQLRYLVVTDRGNFKTVARLFSSDSDRWAGALVAYNAGLGTILQRRAVALRTNPSASSKWFGGLDQVRTPGEKTTMLYNRNLGDMRNDYPRLILQVRAPKYRGLV